MFSIRNCTLASLFVFSVVLMDANALEYLDPRDRPFDFKGMLNDSIPIESGERVVMERAHVPAKWVVVVLSLPYERARKRVQDLVREAFGIHEMHEISVKTGNFRAIDLHEPQEPLFGEGFSGFHAVVSGIKEAREFRIETDEYNRSTKHKGYSVSYWRIGDGEKLFGRPCALLVITRVDHSQEWARDHTGLPWPFKVSGDEWLVTDSEIALVERLKTGDKSINLQYFVPYPANKTNSVFQLMSDITEATRKF